MKNDSILIILAVLIITLCVFWWNFSPIADKNAIKDNYSIDKSEIITEIPSLTFTGTMRYNFSVNKNKNVDISLFCSKGAITVKFYKDKSNLPFETYTLKKGSSKVFVIPYSESECSYSVTFTASKLSTGYGLIVQFD